MKKKQTKKVNQDQLVSTKLNHDKVGDDTSAQHSSSRRRFLSNVGGITVATIATSVIGLPSLSGMKGSEARATDIGPVNGQQRRNQAFQVRLNAALNEKNIPVPAHPDNGDEARYPNRIGNYSKGLRHNSIGEVNPDSYNALLKAIKSGDFGDLEELATEGDLGCSDPSRQRRLVNPQSGYAFDLEGTDSHQFSIPPAPAFASAQEAGEMAELYWMSLLRDANFLDYNTNPGAQAAAADLSNFSDFRGPKQGGVVTTQTLFRDTYPGCTTGPYISQFLLQPVNFGAQRVDTRIQTTTAVDFMTTFNTPGPGGHDSWLDIQNGCNPTATQTPAGLVYCRNGRDLAQYVHIDVLFQAYFVAALNLLSNGYLADAGNPYGVVIDGGAGRPRNTAIDPNGGRAQVGFGTFGGPAIATLVCEPAARA